MAVSGKKNGNFIERSLAGALSFFRDSVFADEYASLNGFMQGWDPRLKVLSILLLILSVQFLKDIRNISILYGVCLMFVVFSKINLWFFLKRTWLFIPLFSLFIAIPAVFKIVTPGEVFYTVRILGIELAMTKQGAAGAFLFVLRVVTSVSLVVLLMLTTRHSELLRALRVLGIPQMFVMVFSICYRYIYLFIEIMWNMHLAVKSRIGTWMKQREGRRFVALSIANLWHKSYQMNTQVYDAMLSRGYRGEPEILYNFKSKTGDWVWFGIVIIVFAGVIYLNYFCI